MLVRASDFFIARHQWNEDNTKNLNEVFSLPAISLAIP
jgi:hypothetical protein